MTNRAYRHPFSAAQEYSSFLSSLDVNSCTVKSAGTLIWGERHLVGNYIFSSYKPSNCAVVYPSKSISDPTTTPLMNAVLSACLNAKHCIQRRCFIL